MRALGNHLAFAHIQIFVQDDDLFVLDLHLHLADESRLALVVVWQRERDSNPRAGYPIIYFRGSAT